MNPYFSLSEKVYDITERYPELIDFLAANGFGKISNPVLCSKLLNDIKAGYLNNILFVATGALMSTTSSQQGESIPSIAHLIHLKGI